MKKTLLLSAMALAAVVSCQKVEMVSPSQEIQFSVESYKTKAASYANGPFGVYAWYKGTVAAENSDFMTDQQVTGTNGSTAVWNPTTTYYWPRTGSIDFIAYSPYGATTRPTITENGITYTDMTVANADLLYSDKVVGATATKSTNGVPILFRHALAQLKVKVAAAYNDIYDAETKTYTRWELVIEDAVSFKDIAAQGSVALVPDDDMVSWEKPANAIWTPTANGAKTTVSFTKPASAVTGTAVELAKTSTSPLYIMPQQASGTKVAFKLTIKTYRGTGDSEEAAKAACNAKVEAQTPDLTESNVEIVSTLKTTNTDTDYWAMNTITTYTLRISPAFNGKVEVPVYVKEDPNNPGKPELNPDGTPVTTTDPDEALLIPDPEDPGTLVPVYPVDKDGDGEPDPVDPDDPTSGIDTDGDGIPDIPGTVDPTDPDKLVEEDEEEGPVKITFDPAVIEWTEVTSSGVEIQQN